MNKFFQKNNQSNSDYEPCFSKACLACFTCIHNFLKIDTFIAVSIFIPGYFIRTAAAVEVKIFAALARMIRANGVNAWQPSY